MDIFSCPMQNVTSGFVSHCQKVPKNKHMFPLCFLFKGQEGLDGERGKPGQQGLPVRDAALL